MIELLDIPKISLKIADDHQLRYSDTTQLMHNSLYTHLTYLVTVKVWYTICKPTLIANQKKLENTRNKFWSDFTVFRKCISLTKKVNYRIQTYTNKVKDLESFTTQLHLT